jgi:putative transposase
MDGRGRALDNVFVAHLGRTVKDAEVSVKDGGRPRETMQVLAECVQLYARSRPHQALGYQTPATVYVGSYV